MTAPFQQSKRARKRRRNRANRALRNVAAMAREMRRAADANKPATEGVR